MTPREILEDWEKFVKGEMPRSFSLIDTQDQGTADLKDIVAAAESGNVQKYLDPLYDSLAHYESEQADAGFKEYRTAFEKDLQQEDDDQINAQLVDDMWDVYRNIFDERNQTNLFVLARGIPILVWNKSMSASLGWVGEPQDAETELKENPDLAIFKDKAERMAGLKPSAFNELIDNGFDYDVLWICRGYHRCRGTP